MASWKKSDAALELVEETVAKINCVDELTPEYVDYEICNTSLPDLN